MTLPIRTATQTRSCDFVDYQKPNEDMTRVAEYAKALARELIAREISVSFFRQFDKWRHRGRTLNNKKRWLVA